ncbi:MAG: hypothetical protein WC495_00860 [Patescibacteria group bacterium]|jgi:hypothetical protein
MGTLSFPLIVFVLGLSVLYGLSITLDRLVMRILGRGWYLTLMWPGVIVHELSHLAGCLITFTRIVDVKLFAPSGETLGYVSHVKTQNPIKNIVISIAPLFGVSLVMAGIMRLLIPETYSVISNLDPSAFASLSGILDMIKKTISSLPFAHWQTYLALYLLITLSSHAAPSRIDLKHAAVGLMGLIILILVIWLIFTWTDIGISEDIITWIRRIVTRTSHLMLIACGFSFLLLCFASILALLKRIIRL